MKNVLLPLVLVIFLFSGCSNADPTIKAQSFAKQGKYEEAIGLLEKELKAKPKSVPVKSLLAQMYSEYGLVICQDNEKEPKVKYQLAKEKFIKAIKLNPYLTDANEMLKMIEKIQAEFSKSSDIENLEDLNKIEDEVAKTKAEERIKSDNKD